MCWMVGWLVGWRDNRPGINLDQTRPAAERSGRSRTMSECVWKCVEPNLSQVSPLISRHLRSAVWPERTRLTPILGILASLRILMRRQEWDGILSANAPNRVKSRSDLIKRVRFVRSIGLLPWRTSMSKTQISKRNSL